MKKKKYEDSYAGYIYEKSAVHWTSAEEMKGHLTRLDFSEPEAARAGGMPILSNGRTVYSDTEDSHMAFVAASGMKKSICGFMPLIRTLAASCENMILTDPKGELFNRMAGFLENQGYRVYCLDFRTMSKDCFNILHYPAFVYRNEDKSKGLSLLSDIINVLAEDQRNHAKDPFWPDTGVLWLNGTGAVMLDSYPKIEQINILNWSDFNTRSSARIIEEHLLPLMPGHTVKAALKQCCSAAENTFRSILITASSFLAMFNQNPKLATMLSHSTFTLEDLIKPKTALFLVTDDTTSTADSILGMIISQIQSYLINKAFHSKDGKLEIRMNFVLDEFASIPIPNMDKALATHRSRNIRYYLCVQSLALLKKRYEDPDALLSNCTATMYLGSTELELLQQLETKLGKTRITADGSERPLCSQAELMMLEKAWGYKEAIYMNFSKGIRYCTMLPSIEAYDIGTYPAPTYDRNLPDIQIYTVAQFATDVVNEKICAPFKEKSEMKSILEENAKKQETTHSTVGNDEISLQEEITRKFNELFGPLDD